MADVATAPKPLARRRPPQAAARRPPRAEGAAQRRGVGVPARRGDLLRFFSWYPIVREVIMSFQKPIYGGGYAWAGWL